MATQSATMADYLSQLSKRTGSGQFFSGMTTQDVRNIAGTLLNTVNNYMMSLRNKAVNNKDINAATTFFKLYTALRGGGASAEPYIQNFKDNLNKQPRDYAEILDGASYDLVSQFSRNLDMAQRSLQGYGGDQEAAKDIIASMVNRAVPFLPEITAMANSEEKQILGKISPELVKGATAAGIETTAIANQQATGVLPPPRPAGSAPLDAQGNPIPQEKWAEMGITNTPTQTPTFQTTANQPTTNYWKSPSGTIVGVSAGSEAETNFKNLGWTQSTSAEEVAGRQVQNISPTGEIQTTTGGQTTGQAPTGGQAPVSGQNPQTQWVNDYYQKYFDRPATQAELDNWGKETPQNLEAFLKQEAQRYGYTSKTFQTEESQRLQSAYDKIDGSNLPPELKQLYKDVVKNYPPGIEFDANEILNTFQKIKDETIDPQYRNYIAQAEKGLTQNLADIEQQRVSELEQERSQAGLAIRQAKEGLEKAGMTFTGKAIETLGSEAAIPQGATGAETTPTQEPFGGLFYEGLVPQYNRLSSSSSQARYESALKSLGLSAEQQLGTAGVSKFGISGYTPVGGTTGTLEEQKKQTEASTLQQLLNNYQEKQKSLTNLTFSS
jgi:hypothetical protein